MDTDDRDFWISDIKNTFFGDTNLDGQVNVVDLNSLALSWRTHGATSWSQGDFNGDGNVNASELNDLALNWRSGVGEPLPPRESLEHDVIAVRLPTEAAWLTGLGKLSAS